MEIKVFGPGCPKCAEAMEIVSAVVQECGIEANIEKISDFKEMMAHGVMSTPAVAIDGKVVCTGHVPAKAELMQWLKGNTACCSGKSGGGSCACGGKC